jgi:hypothetical protein
MTAEHYPQFHYITIVKLVFELKIKYTCILFLNLLINYRANQDSTSPSAPSQTQEAVYEYEQTEVILRLFFLNTVIIFFINIIMALEPFVGLWPLFSSLILNTSDRTP